MAQGRARRFVASSSVYFLGSVLSHLIQFFLLPLYTRAIPPDQYGNYDLWTNLLIFLAPVAFFQVWDAVYRYWFDRTDRAAVVTNGYLMMGLGLLVYTVTLVPVLALTGAAPAGLIFVFGFSWCLVYFSGYLARAQLRNGLFVGTGVLNTLLNASLGIFLVLVARWEILGVYVAVVAGNLIQALVIEVRLCSHRQFRRSLVARPLINEMLRFSLPLCLASVAGWGLSGLTRIGINAMLGDGANGLYAVADKFTYVITMVMSVFIYAWNELLYTSHQDADRKDLYRRGTAAVLDFAIIGGAGTILFARLTWDLLVGPSYREAWPLVPYVAAAAALNSAAGFIASLFMAEKRTNPILWTTLTAAAVNAALIVPFISWFGLPGAPVALTLACATMLVSRAVVTSRLLGVSVLRPDMVLSLLVFAGVSAFYWTEPTLPWTVVAGFLVGVYFLVRTRPIWTPFLGRLRARTTAKEDAGADGSA